MPNIKAKGLQVSYMIFFIFSLYKSYISLCKTCDPPAAGPSHFGPLGHDLNKLGRGPLDNASYQILRL